MEDRHVKAFKEESYEILSELENLLLELEANPADEILIDSVFGAMHTIKGSGAMFGFDAVSEFAHEIETVLDLVREGILPVSSDLISLTLSARDKILEMLDSEIQTVDDDAHLIISGFKGLIDTVDALNEEAGDELAKAERKTVTYRIRFKPDPDIFMTGTNPLLLLAELQKMGECTILARTDEIPLLDVCDPESCYVSWELILTTDKDIKEIQDVFIFVENSCQLAIEPIVEQAELTEQEDYKRLGEILMDRGDISREDLQKILSGHKRLGEMLVETEVIQRSNIDAALREQEHVRKVIQQEKNRQQLTSIRVDATRLDNLVDLVGELVTVQAQLTEKAGGMNDAQLQVIAESVERLTEELRDNAMSIRMIPIGTLFSRYRRLVRDLSQEMRKEVQVISEGAATELDKTVIDQLNEPLVHIIRNAIDHGIELPEERESLGKPPRGTVTLSARHVGTVVEISISDDGAGLDPEMLRSRAVGKGIIAADEDLSDEECYALILLPGFTTSAALTEVSGRGVGMDVVKRSIDNLRGSIMITSTKGEGTTIILRLSVTLAIIDGLLVRVGGEFFIIPLAIVHECIELAPEDSAQFMNRSMMTFRGEAFSFISLRKAFGVESDPAEMEKVILVSAFGKKIGISVDEVIGQHQTVIKPLSWVYGNIDGISGATILGDGTIALIVDVNQLADAEKDKVYKDRSTGGERSKTTGDCLEG